MRWFWNKGLRKKIELLELLLKISECFSSERAVAIKEYRKRLSEILEYKRRLNNLVTLNNATINNLQDKNAKLKQQIENQEFKEKIQGACEAGTTLRKIVQEAEELNDRKLIHETNILKSLLKNQKVEPIIKYPFNLGAEFKEVETISDIVKMWEQKPKVDTISISKLDYQEMIDTIEEQKKLINELQGYRITSEKIIDEKGVVDSLSNIQNSIISCLHAYNQLMEAQNACLGKTIKAD